MIIRKGNLYGMKLTGEIQDIQNNSIDKMKV